MGVVPLQFAFDVQGTQVPAVVLQTGVAPLHWLELIAEHWPHAPLGSQAGVAPPHWLSLEHAWHVCVPALQTGVVPEQSALATHRTQVPLAALQTGVPPVHCAELPVEHWPQAPLGSQAGVVPPHSLSPLQPRHVRKEGSQIGVAPPQSAFARQPTHVFVVVLQTGVVPEHWLLFRHWTQVVFDVSQTGVEPLQRPGFDAEQTPQPPVGSQAGAVPGHSELAAQLRQV
jgi:hypothetical protein